MPAITLVTTIAAPVERCFDLMRSVGLLVDSTASTAERAGAGLTSGLLGLGDEVTLRARHFGVVQRLTGRIVAYDRPRHFRDEQVRGTFERLRHDHYFESEGANDTRMTDVFEFRAPLGPLGRLAERLFLTAYMRRFLASRNAVVKRVAESPSEWQRYVGGV